MIQTHTNYQTSFRVVDPDRTALHTIQRILFKWVTTKEKDPELRNNRKRFYFRGEWRGLERSSATVETDSYLENGVQAWAFNYIHQDSELKRRRYWYTDVGLRQLKDEVVVFVRVAYGWNAQDLSHDQNPPTPSVPYFVRTIVKELKAFSGRHEFRLLERPLVFTERAQNKILWEFLRSEKRRYPLIVFNGSSEHICREANKLAIQLTGKAQVVITAAETGQLKRARSPLPNDVAVRPGFLRVFFPFGNRPVNPIRHRWYDPSSESYQLDSEGIVNGLLRNHGLYEAGVIESIKDVRRLVSRTKLLRQIQKEAGESPQIAELLSLVERTESEVGELKESLERAKQEADFYADEGQRHEELARKLHHDNAALKARLEEAGKTPHTNLSEVITKLPTSLIEVVRLAESLLTRLSFADQAKKSAADYHDCESLHDAWEIFFSMHHKLYDFKFGERSFGNLEQAFVEETGYELTLSESGSTNRDAKLSRMRRIEHDGSEYDISPHIKHGTRAPKMLRVHFAFDEQNKRLVVGYVGEHMDTAGTKRGRGR